MTLRLKGELRRWGAEVVLSIYRRWRRDRGWTDWPTYRYVGVVLNWQPRFGRHVDYAGRVYTYLGFFTFWQDVRPASRPTA